MAAAAHGTRKRGPDGEAPSCRTFPCLRGTVAGTITTIISSAARKFRPAARSYKADCTAVTQALQVAVIEPTINSSELDNELDLTICWVCFFLPKPMNMSTVRSKVVKHW